MSAGDRVAWGERNVDEAIGWAARVGSLSYKGGMVSNGRVASRRVVLTTFGSLGDLHPFLAIGQALGRRGHRAVVATLPVYEERVRAAGLAFWPVRAAVLAGEPTSELIRRVFDRRRGVESIVRQMVMPALRTAYEDTLAAADGADLLVAHPLTFATRLVAEVRGLPWASTQLAPMGFLSAYDPPVLSEAPGLGRLRGWGRGSGGRCSGWRSCPCEGGRRRMRGCGGS